MSLSQIQPPEKFGFKPEDWQRWVRRFERFRIASELYKASEENQVNTLIYMMGVEDDAIVQSLGISDEEQKKYDTVKQKFQDYFIIQRNVIFNLRSQQENEPVEAFITDLFNLAEHCNFGSLREELIRDRIVVGIRDKNLSEKLQLESDLTLEKAVNLVRQRETVRKQEFLNAEEKSIGYVKKMKGKPVRPESQKTKQDDQGKHSHSGKCGRCLGPKHAVKDCPAKESDCRKCVIPPGIFKQISDNEKLEATKKVLLGPCNYQLKCLGKFKAKLKSKGHCIVEDVYVVEALNRPLLGKTACASLNLLNICKSDNVQSLIQTDCVKVNEDSYKQAIMRQYPKLFEGLGEIEGEYEMKLKSKAEPYALNVPTKVPFPMLEKTKQEIERVL